MGVEIEDAFQVASLIGTKVFADEFISFRDLTAMVCKQEIKVCIVISSRVSAFYRLLYVRNFYGLSYNIQYFCIITFLSGSSPNLLCVEWDVKLVYSLGLFIPLVAIM